MLLGRAWQRRRLGGHEVVRLVRRPPMSPAEITWDPATGQIDADALEGFDAVIHLTGENIGAGLAHARLGPVRSPRAGMLKRLLPVFRAGAGGVVGGGRQPISWIGLDDAIGALHLLMGAAGRREPSTWWSRCLLQAEDLLQELDGLRLFEVERSLHHRAGDRVPALARLRVGQVAERRVDVVALERVEEPAAVAVDRVVADAEQRSAPA